MHLSRFAAIVALPAALSLAACGGGSSGILNPAVGPVGQQGYVRFVQGSPQDANVDLYMVSTGATPGTTPLATIAYGTATDFIGMSTTAYTLQVRAAGSGSTGALIASCPIPQLQNNAKYSVVLGHSTVAGGAMDCVLFQDMDYTGGTPQYRFHDAATALGTGSSVGFGVITAANAPPGTPFSVQGNAQLGGLAMTPSGGQFLQTTPVAVVSAATTNAVSFAVGAATTSGTTEPSWTTLSSQYLTTPSGTSQPNTGGGLPYGSSPGSSIFAINCVPTSSTTLPAGTTCGTNGVALIGQLDTK